MGTKFDLPPDAKIRTKDEEEHLERRTLQEWTRPQSADHRIALGIDAEGELWVAERKGEAIEIGQAGKEAARTVEAPLADPQNPRSGLPRLLGSELLVGTPEGLRLGEALVLRGRFECYDGARHGDSRVLIASGTPEGGEPGTYWVSWPEPGRPHVERLSGPANGVSAWHDAERIGLAWADGQGVHTVALSVSGPRDVGSNLVSYYSTPDEKYTAPSVAVDQTGKAYVLFYIFGRTEGGPWTPKRDMQLNFERIAFKGSASEDGHFPVNLIHRKRIYMIYGLKPNATTARWRVPGTTMWDGAEHIPGSFPQAVSDGKSLYVATSAGLFAMGGGTADEGLDLLSHSWASPEGDVGPRNTLGARLRRWFGF